MERLFAAAACSARTSGDPRWLSAVRLGSVGGARVIQVDAGDADATRAAVAEAALVLVGGGLVAVPTETVYGLAALACDADAVARIFSVKGRPADNPLIVHVGSAAAAAGLAADWTPLAARLAQRWWPGSLTLVVEAAPGLAPGVTAGLTTVAVRVPGHAVARALAARGPFAAPSANSSGRPSPTTAAHVMADLGTGVDLVLDAGPCRLGVESTVVDARGDDPVVLRPGPIGAAALGLACVSAPPADPAAGSPGLRHRHYAPSCEVVVAAAGDGAAVAARLAAVGRHTGLVAPSPAPPGVVGLARVRDAEHLAAALYAALRAGDEAGLDVLVVEAVAEVGIGVAVMDRLRRAAAGSAAPPT